MSKLLLFHSRLHKQSPPTPDGRFVYLGSPGTILYQRVAVCTTVYTSCRLWGGCFRRKYVCRRSSRNADRLSAPLGSLGMRLWSDLYVSGDSLNKKERDCDGVQS